MKVKTKAETETIPLEFGLSLFNGIDITDTYDLEALVYRLREEREKTQ